MVEEKTSKKKQLILAGIGLAFLLVLVIGATYAYFTFVSDNQFKDPATMEGSMGELGAGVTLTKAEDSTLTLNLSAADMLVENAGYYYASGSETPKTIATVKVAGGGRYNCTYTLEVTKSATSPETDMYERIQSGEYYPINKEIYFTINDTIYDFITPNLFNENNKLYHTETITLISNKSNEIITANMSIFNDPDYDQTFLNGTDISLSIDATEFNCELVNEKPTVTSLTYAGVGTDSITVEIDTKEGYEIETYHYSIDGGAEIINQESNYKFENLEMNTEYEITAYVTNTLGNKSDPVMETFTTIPTDNLGEALEFMADKGEVYNISPIKVGDYSNATTVTDAIYEMFSSTSYSSTSGTTMDNAFTYNNGTYTSVPENLTPYTYYHAKITIPSDGYYRVCHSLPDAEDEYNLNNRMYLYKNDKNIHFANINIHNQDGCQNLGFVNAGEYVKVVQYTYSDNSTSIAPISFYIQRTEETKEITPGYRYQGATPNNYVTFNGETWRIIGAVDGNEIGLTNENNYTKIIREDSIGNLTYYDFGEYLDDWPSTNLYNILNEDYYNRLNTYSSIGLTEESKGLIVSANWYHTKFGALVTASQFYINERNDVSAVTNAYVGLMSPSDFGYAASTEVCENIQLGGIFINDAHLCHEKDWLYNKKSYWTMIPHSDIGVWYYIAGVGYLDESYGGANASDVIPTVYLDTDVIITGGNGSESSPYTIAKPTS